MPASNENRPSTVPDDSRGALFSLALSGALFSAVHVMLLDCAIETHLAESPLRWWISGVVGIYFTVLTGVIWRVGRSGMVGILQPGALSGTILLIALVCLSSLHPAGLSVGVRLLGMSTSTVQISTTILGIGLFGVLWGLNSQIDYRLRIGGGLLALYGVMSFLFGLVNGTPYVDLVQGAAFWAALPLLFQGTIVGSLLFLPLALVHQIALTIRSDRRKVFQTWSARTICGVLCILLAVQGFSYQPSQFSSTGVVRAEQNPTAPAQELLNEKVRLRHTSAQATKSLPARFRQPVIATSSPVNATAQNVIEKFDEATALLANAAQLFEDIPLSPDDVVKLVGNEPVDLYQWVRDNTAFVVYRGVLRGPEGVLADRDGNSLDRSLLLQSLLTLAGHHSRLASGTLDNASALKLVNNSKLSASRLPFSSLEVTDPQLSRIRNRVLTQSEQIIQLLEHPSNGLSDEAAVIAKVVDHWWVQLQIGGQWIDLDTLAPGPEKALTTANANYTEETLPKNLYQQVTIRLLLETKGEQANRHVLAEISRPAMSLNGKTIHLGHLPLGVDHTAMKSATSVEATLDVMAGVKAWMPRLSFDGATIRGSMITASGEIVKATDASVNARKGTGPFESIMKKLHATQALSPLDTLVSEWIEIEVAIPGREKTIIRRVLFDDKAIQQEVNPSKSTNPNQGSSHFEDEKQNDDRVRAETERAYSLWEGEQAELDQKRLVCSEQSGRDLEELWVLEKDAISDTPKLEDLELLTELYESDTCLDLFTALASAAPEPTGQSPYHVPAYTPDPLEFYAELKVSPADRAARRKKVAGFLRSVHFSVEIAKLSGAALTHRLQNKLSRLTKLRNLIESGSDQLDRSRAKEFMPDLLTLQTELDYLAYQRWKIHAGGDELFKAQPSITLIDRSIDKLGEDYWVFNQSIDIAMNPVEVRPGSTQSPFNARLAQGVADTLSEALIHPASDLPINMSLIHDLAVGHGVGFNRLSPDDRDKVEALDLPKSAKDLLMQDLVAGHHILVPKQLIDFGTGYASWWRVDPVTGNTLGMISNGAGGATAAVLTSDVIGMIIYLGIILDAYFWADCVSGGQEKIFFFMSIEGADLGKRLTLCSFEMLAMNALFAAALKLLSGNSGSILSFMKDESGSMRLGSKPPPKDIPLDEGKAHRIYGKDTKVPQAEADRVGMNVHHMEDLAKHGDSDNEWGIFRGSKKAGRQYQGKDDYASKQVDVKWKTDHVDGLVHLPVRPMTPDDELQWIYLHKRGYSGKDGLLIDPDGKMIFGDHDLMGVYDKNGRSVWSEEWNDMINESVFRDSGDMLRHGGNDNFLFPDYANPYGAGIPGRYPDPDEYYFAFDPDGNKHIFDSTEALKEFYCSTAGFVWVYGNCW